VLFDSFNSDGLKRAVAYVQRDLNDLYAVRSQTIQQRGSEVQPGSRGSYSSALARIHGLIAHAVKPVFSGPLDVRRERRAAYAINDLVEIAARLESNYATALFAPLDYFGSERAARKLYARACQHRFTGANKRFPDERLYLSYEKHFDARAGTGLTRRSPEPSPEQSSGKNPRVVYDEQVASD
jgi:hypothetical protein